MTTNRCKVGDTVIHEGEQVWVSAIVCQGREDRYRKNGDLVKGEKADITVCRIMPDNGQVLKRSPFNIGTDWRHEKV